MRMKTVYCTNANGDTLTISKTSDFKPIEDINTTGLKAGVTYATNYRVNGATMVSSRLQQRDFQLSFFIQTGGKSTGWIQDTRDKIFKVFNPMYNPLSIRIVTDEKDVTVEANVEVLPLIGIDFASSNRLWEKVLVQLSAGTPFFKDSVTQRAEIAAWEPLFEFPYETTASGIEMGVRTQSLIVDVLNSGHIPTGMVIEFRALGSLTNPSLMNVNTRESFKINKALDAGEVITVNTNQGKKKVTSSLNGVTTNIFNYVDYQSKFMQLNVGDNLFRYNADTNIDSLVVTIYFTPQYLGV